VHKTFKFVLTLVSIVWVTASSGQENWTTDQKEIVDANDSYIQAILAEDLNLLITFYTEDATLTPPMSPAIKGKSAVRASWAEGMKQATVIKAVSVFDEILVFGNWAYGRGRYEGRSIPDDGGPEYEEKLNFSGMWHRDPDGSWKIARDMWNSGASEQ
jgi:ketosteroid isomerase-like protein